MKIINTDISGILVIEPAIFADERGFFQETWNEEKFNIAIGRSVKFCQDNHSHSSQGVLRGLHYQYRNPQCKLIRVAKGSVLDIVVDMRKSSPTFGKHYKIKLTDSNRKQLWIPEGFAHGFYALSEKVDFIYKVTEFYDENDEECVLWNDTFLNINWEISGKNIIISEKDTKGKAFEDAKFFK
jgi:dTDP-4-dehydrorhamnose 3,5-epimerase